MKIISCVVNGSYEKIAYELFQDNTQLVFCRCSGNHSEPPHQDHLSLIILTIIRREGLDVASIVIHELTTALGDIALNDQEYHFDRLDIIDSAATSLVFIRYVETCPPYVRQKFQTLVGRLTHQATLPVD